MCVCVFWREVGDYELQTPAGGLVQAEAVPVDTRKWAAWSVPSGQLLGHIPQIGISEFEGLKNYSLVGPVEWCC